MKCCPVCNHRGKRSALDKLLSPLKDLLTAKMRLVENLLEKDVPEMVKEYKIKNSLEGDEEEIVHAIPTSSSEEIDVVWEVLGIFPCWSTAHPIILYRESTPAKQRRKSHQEAPDPGDNN